MYLTRYNNRNNICGANVFKLRNAVAPYLSQHRLALKLQSIGFDCDRIAVRRIENGERFVTDIELALLAQAFGISVLDLLKDEDMA